ncbi:MAG: DUF167 domain-containing protein [bacterium]|nr:DUF167 domain-containing protein [bacterium]
MKVFVKVKPKTKENKIEKISAETGSPPKNRFDIWVKEPPIEGRANEAVCKVMAEHFGVPLANVKIISGKASRQKIIEIKE